jgi:hypothetical protein
MKATIIKAWPELIDFLPSLHALTDQEQRAAAKKANVLVSFRSVRSVNSTGLTVFLLRLLRFVGDKKQLKISYECSEEIKSKLETLGVYSNLTEILGSVQHELLLIKPKDRKLPSLEENPPISSPIYRLKFSAFAERREAVYEFVKWLADRIMRLSNNYKLQANGLPMLLNEIAKNSADHTTKDAFFGMDLKPINERKSRFNFVFGDLGLGIKQHVAENLPSELENRKAKMSLYEAYRLALTPGFTGKPRSAINQGQGMSTIVGYATKLNVNLSIFDAKSRGLLSNFKPVSSPTHSAVRMIFHNVGNDVGFFYYGDCIFEKLEER